VNILCFQSLEERNHCCSTTSVENGCICQSRLLISQKEIPWLLVVHNPTAAACIGGFEKKKKSFGALFHRLSILCLSLGSTMSVDSCVQLLIGELPGVGTLNVCLSSQETVGDLEKEVWKRLGYHWPLVFLYGGKLVSTEERLLRFVNGSFLQARPLGVLKGGKGGFGTLLRGQAAFRKKSQNVSACRDLEGRRLRDVEAEKKLSKWYADREQHKDKQGGQCNPEQARRAEEKEEARRQQEALKAQVGNTCKIVEENTENAVSKGFSVACKRKQSAIEREKTHGEEAKRRVQDASKRRWMFPLLEEESSDEEQEDSTTSPTTCLDTSCIPSSSETLLPLSV